MKTRKIFCSLVVAGLVVAIGAPSAALAGDTASFQASNMVDFATGEAEDGGGTLTRTRNALWANLNTTGLLPNTVYTVWWIIWNRPENCTDGCGEDDLGVPGNAIFYGTGFISGPNGNANVSAHVEAGNSRLGIQNLLGWGLRPHRGHTAEAHLLIRSHGAPVAGSVDLQISDVDGLCEVNECIDDQAIVFLPLVVAAP